MDSKTNSVYQVEKSLGKRLSDLQSQLETHSKTLAGIKDTHEKAVALAKQNYDKALIQADSNYKTAIASINADEATGARAARDKYESAKSSLSKEETALVTNREANVVAIDTIKRQWDTYIVRVHEEFTSSINGQKKRKAKDLEDRLGELTKRSNRRIARNDDDVNYEQLSPLGSALIRPFKFYPEWWGYVRTPMIIAGLIWIAIMIVKGFRCVNSGGSIEGLYCSLWVTRPLLILCIYLACAYVVSFITTISAAADFNRRSQSEAIARNKQMIADKASATEELKTFEERYSPIFKVNGKWNFDWQRCPIGKAEADALMAGVIKRNASLHPTQTPRGISEYVFEIDYNALH